MTLAGSRQRPTADGREPTINPIADDTLPSDGRPSEKSERERLFRQLWRMPPATRPRRDRQPSDPFDSRTSSNGTSHPPSGEYTNPPVQIRAVTAVSLADESDTKAVHSHRRVEVSQGRERAPIHYSDVMQRKWGRWLEGEDKHIFICFVY